MVIKNGMQIEIEEDDLRRMYEEEGRTLAEIGNWYGVSNNTIGRRMRVFGIESRVPRIYAVNEDFFKVWTKESAWVFGWVIGDGNMDDDRLRFYLARKDKEVLYKFKKIVDSEHPVKDVDNYHKDTGKMSELSCLNIGSIEMVEDLRKLHYKDIPEWHRSHGIRGFWEAEGSVWLQVDKKGGTYEYIRTALTQKDTTILQWIWDVLRDEGVIEGGSLGWSHLVFGEADSVSLYHYLYDDYGELYLPRKKSRFEELMARRGYL